MEFYSSLLRYLFQRKKICFHIYRDKLSFIAVTAKFDKSVASFLTLTFLITFCHYAPPTHHPLPTAPQQRVLTVTFGLGPPYHPPPLDSNPFHPHHPHVRINSISFNHLSILQFCMLNKHCFLSNVI